MKACGASNFYQKTNSTRNKLMFSEVERQIRRDRINQIKPWLKSTGARTLEGKRISSKNALKHGLYSADPNIRAIAKANQLQAERDRIRSILCTYGLIKQ